MDSIAIGTVYGSHGVHGHLKVGSFSGEYDHFQSLREVELRRGDASRRFSVQEMRRTDRGVLVKLDGIDTPEMARTYARWEIWVPRAHGCPLGDGEYYAADLCGCSLVYRAEASDSPTGELSISDTVPEETIGTVVSVWDNGVSDLLEVVRPDGTRVVVPFLERFVGTVDMVGRRIALKERWVIE